MMLDSVIRATDSPSSFHASLYERIWFLSPLASTTYSLRVSISHTANVTFICN